MRAINLTPRISAAALTITALALAGNPALAAEYWLKAAPTAVAMPDPGGGAAIMVPMWGYASCTDGSFGSCGPTTVPGPALAVPAGDSALTVNLLNGLTAPTSLVIHGIIKPMAPVWFEPLSPSTTYTSGRPLGNTTARVRSFDAEAAPGGIAAYTWPSVKPGTYLYQSGTQPQVQVQMGLYGAATKNAVEAVAGATPVRAQAYPGATYSYDNQATLLYSEIDPALHTAVAGGTYGTLAGPTSTLNYEPKYFLVNGAPFLYGAPAIAPAGNVGTTLLRLLNAGLMTHVPEIQGRYWEPIAEDGKPYPYRFSQYTALLPAAKTMDLLLAPPDIGGAAYAIMDRRLNLSNAGLSNGGMLAVLSYGVAGVSGPGGTSDGNLAPLAVDDEYASVAGVELSIGAAAGVLANDSDPDALPQPIRAVAASGSTTAGGTYALNANGSFTYSPPSLVGAGPWTDTFSYSVTDGKALSVLPATVSIALSRPLAPAVTLLDDFTRTVALPNLGADWKQTASTTSPADVQVDGATAKALAANLGGQAIWVNGSGVFGAKQSAAFTAVGPLYNSALILKATGGTPETPANFVRVRHEVLTPTSGEFVVATLIGGSNTGVYVKQAGFPTASVPAGGGMLSAAVDAKGMVTVFYNGGFVGGVQLPDVGAWKGGGKIGVQLQTVGAAVDNFSGGTLLP